MLWFLHLCAANGIVVISYTDAAQGTMAEGEDGGGEFTAVTLRPRAAIADSGQADRALELHEEAHRLCSIARSVNFPVSCEPAITRLQVPKLRCHGFRGLDERLRESGSAYRATRHGTRPPRPISLRGRVGIPRLSSRGATSAAVITMTLGAAGAVAALARRAIKPLPVDAQAVSLPAIPHMFRIMVS
jgi:hypothetical protein